MTTPITVENLESAGFSDTLNGTLPRQALGLNPSRDFKKGNLVVRMWGSNRIAWTWSGEELGPISTMEQVQALDSVINPVPSDAITGDRLESSGWTPLGDGVFNHQYLRLVTRRTPPASYCVYHRSGEMLGIAWKMTEVSALADVTTRRA